MHEKCHYGVISIVIMKALRFGMEALHDSLQSQVVLYGNRKL